LLPTLLYHNLKNPGSILREREKLLAPIKNRLYDFVITEQYPFSKQTMDVEVDPLLDGLKKQNPACQVFCSLKGIMLPIAGHEWIGDKIERFYDAILNHADPSIVAAEEFIKLTPEMHQKLIYTGFVTDPTPLDFTQPRVKRIVVSMGAGSYGDELITTALKIPPLFSDYEFLFSLGPKVHPGLAAEAKKSPYPNVKVVDFINDFTTVLSRSSLSISLGGSTLLDAMKARIPSLVYAESHEEHIFRSLKFMRRGGIQLIRKQDLFPTRLAAAIQTILQRPYAALPPLLNGAEFTHAYLMEKLR